jgi:hypothetical protein
MSKRSYLAAMALAAAVSAIAAASLAGEAPRCTSCAGKPTPPVTANPNQSTTSILDRAG